MDLKEASIKQINDVMIEKVSCRLYEYDGVVGAGVSSAVSLIQPYFLQSWKSRTSQNAQNKTKQKAAGFGTAAHKMAQDAVEGKEVTPDPNQDKEALTEWFTDWKSAQKKYDIGEASYTEVRVFSKMFGFGGTVDFIGPFQGKMSVVDYKSGSFSYLDLQKTESYRQAVNEMLGENAIEQAVALYVPRPDKKARGAETKAYTVAHQVPNFLAFLCAYEEFKMIYWRELKKAGMKDDILFNRGPFKLYEREYGEGCYRNGYPTEEK